MRFSNNIPRVAHVAMALALNCLVIIQGHTKENAKDIESLIEARNWKDTSRSIFLEAQNVNPREWSIAVNQAKSGFIDDAIASAQLMFPVSRSMLLLEVSQSAPTLPLSRQKELVHAALKNAKGDTGSDYHRSGDLAAICLIYVAWGMDSAAQAIYGEALSAAEKGFVQQGNGGYRRISEELLKVDVQLVREWMLDPLLKRIANTSDPLNLVFTYRDLAQLEYRMGKKSDAIGLLNQGISASTKMEAGNLKAAAVGGLANLAIEIGEIGFAERYGEQRQLLPSYAIYKAATGSHSEALALISKLKNGFYVDHKTEVQSKIVSDAVRRGDINSAIFYAERLSECPASIEMSLWTQIAALQATNGDKKSARASYTRAEELLRKKKESEYYSQEIAATVTLGESMFKNGFRDDGSKIVSAAVRQIQTIPSRRAQDRISTRARTAPILTVIGKHAAATDLLLEAYWMAHDYPESNSTAKMEKAALLSEIGIAAGKMSESGIDDGRKVQ